MKHDSRRTCLVLIICFTSLDYFLLDSLKNARETVDLYIMTNKQQAILFLNRLQSVDGGEDYTEHVLFFNLYSLQHE
jgi:hypothetical protein